MENPTLEILALVAFVLLVFVTGGIGYLTFTSWGDRRLQEQEKRDMRLSSKSGKAAKAAKRK